MKNHIQYHQGKIAPFVEALARKFGFDAGYAMAQLGVWFPELRDKTRCANCGGSMVEYVFTFDCFNALLLYIMGNIVKERLSKGVPFSVANQVHIQSIPDPSGSLYAVKSRTTQASKLGLIAKLKGTNGKQVSGTWVITDRGWKALRGERVPKNVKVWNGQIVERFDDMTTINEAFQMHRFAIEEKIRRNKEPQKDMRGYMSGYSASDFFEIGSYHQGAIV